MMSEIDIIILIFITVLRRLTSSSSSDSWQLLNFVNAVMMKALSVYTQISPFYFDLLYFRASSAAVSSALLLVFLLGTRP